VVRLARRAAARAGALALALGWSACTSGAQEGDATHVGVAMPTTASPRWIADGENVKAQLEDLGHVVDLQHADDVPTRSPSSSRSSPTGPTSLSSVPSTARLSREHSARRQRRASP